MKSDRKVPATFRQPDDPPAGVQVIASPKPDVSAIRFAVRSTSRSSKDFAAACIFSSIIYSRLKARVPAAFASNVFVRNEQNFLPGILIIGFSAGKNDLGSGNGKIDASDLVSAAMSEVVNEVEFKSAKAENASRWNFRTADMFWLDNDTYKTQSVEAERLVFENVTLADVRAFADSLKNSPMASVLVNTPPATN